MERLSATADRLRPLARMLAAVVYRQMGSGSGPRGPAESIESVRMLGVRVAGGRYPALATDCGSSFWCRTPSPDLFDGDAVADVARGLSALGYEPLARPMMPAGKAAHVKGDRAGFTRQAQRLRGYLRQAALERGAAGRRGPGLHLHAAQRDPKAGVTDLPEVVGRRIPAAGTVKRRAVPVRDSGRPTAGHPVRPLHRK